MEDGHPPNHTNLEGDGLHREPDSPIVPSVPDALFGRAGWMILTTKVDHPSAQARSARWEAPRAGACLATRRRMKLTSSRKGALLVSCALAGCASPIIDDAPAEISSEAVTTPPKLGKVSGFRHEGTACPAGSSTTFGVSPDHSAVTVVFGGTPHGTCKMSFEVIVPAGVQITTPRFDLRGFFAPSTDGARGRASAVVGATGLASASLSKAVSSEGTFETSTATPSDRWTKCAKTATPVRVTAEFTTTATNGRLVVDSVDWELASTNTALARKCVV